MYKLLISTERDYPKLTQCLVTGKIPEWLNGNLYRNGGGLYKFGSDIYNHLFDGMAMLHRFDISSGGVSYMNRFLDSDVYQINSTANKIVMDEFATTGSPDPNLPFFKRYFYYILRDMTDNASVTVTKIKNSFFAKTESSKIWKFNPESLEAEKKFDLRKTVPVHISLAHMMVDDENDVWNVGTEFSLLKTKYIVMKTPSKDEEDPFKSTKIIAKINSDYRTKPGYMHSFGMTEKYVVLIEQGFKFNLIGLFIAFLTKQPFVNAMLHNDSFPCFFHLVSKESGKVLKYRIDPSEHFTFFHFINAFQEANSIIIDISAYPCKGTEFIKSFMLSELEKEATFHVPQIWRFILPLDERMLNEHQKDENTHDGVTIKPHKFSNFCTDLATINPHYQGKNYRFVYGIQIEESISGMAKIAKFDLETGLYKSIDYKNCIPHEPIFVPKPGSSFEDDGTVLSPWSSPCKSEPSYLLFLNGSNFEEVARAEIPKEIKMPFTFHGIFVQN